MRAFFVAALSACLLSSAPSAAPVTVPIPSPGTVQAAPVPSAPCVGANKASQWDGANWQCATISGGGGGGSVLEGLVNVRRVGGVWQGFDENGTSICSASPTFCIKEMLAYGRPAGFPVHVFGLGTGIPFTIVDEELFVAASQGAVPVYCWGCELRFDNHVSSKPGLRVDTMLFSGLFNIGGHIRYCGSNYGVRFEPKTNLGVVWTMHNDFWLGSIEGAPDCPVAIGGLVGVDINQTCGANQPASSAFVNNHLTGFMIGGLKSIYNFRYLPPSCPQSAGGENFFFWWDNKDALQAEVYIGNYAGNALDSALGTSWYIGNIAHTMGGTTYAIMSNSSWDVFWMTSVNMYNSGPTYSAYSGPQGCLNIVRTTQTILGSSGQFWQDNCPAHNNVVGRP